MALNLDSYDDDRGASFIKHELLEGYLREFCYKVGQFASHIVYVDAFAGPWDTRSDDHSDTSFSVATQVMARARQGLDHGGKVVSMHAILVERNRAAFGRLKEYVEQRKNSPVQMTPLHGDFESHVESVSQYIDRLGNKAFRFVLLDPKGWSGLSMHRIKCLIEGRTSEVLVNVMVRHIRRFLEQSDRAKSYRDFFGRKGVRKIVSATEKDEVNDVIVREYCKSLKENCDFLYVSSCLVMDTGKNAIRYFLVYGTNHHKGIEVFKDAEERANSAQHCVENRARKNRREELSGSQELDLFTQNTFLEKYTKKYRVRALEAVKKELGRKGKMLFRDVFCEAAAFPLVTKRMIVSDLESAHDIKIELEPGKNGRMRKSPSTEKADYVFLIDSQ